MTTTKEFCIRASCSQEELTRRVNAGWAIQFMQFMQDGTLHVVFVRDAVTPAPAAPTVEVVNVPVKPIQSVKLPAHICIVGLDEPRSVPLTHNKPKPERDPVMEEALQRGRNTFNRVRAEGETLIKNARPSFVRNQ